MSKICKKRVYGNDKNNLPWAFKKCSGSLYLPLLLLCKISPPKVFWGKVVLKICSKFSGEHPCRSVISIKLQNNFIGIALRHGCSPVNLLNIFRTPFYKNRSEGLLHSILWNTKRLCFMISGDEDTARQNNTTPS